MSAREYTLRKATAEDAQALSQIAERSITVSYSLSPTAIETLVDAEFEPSVIEEKVETPDLTLLVAHDDGERLGFVEATDAYPGGAVRWIHVHPDSRGEGIGRALFDNAVTAVSSDGRSVSTFVVGKNVEGRGFVEARGYHRTDERMVDIGGYRFVEYVYESPTDEQTTDRAEQAPVDQP